MHSRVSTYPQSPCGTAIAKAPARSPFGLLPQGPWLPWPGEEPPEISLARHLPNEPLVLLAGNAQGGERGRFGLLGWVQSATAIDADPQGLIAHLCPPTPGTLKVFLLGYELGYPWAHLPQTATDVGHRHGWVIEVQAGWISDHQTRTYCPWGKAVKSVAGMNTPSVPGPAGHARLQSAVGDEVHGQRIQTVQEAIAAGEIYQANLARPLRVRGRIDALNTLSHLVQRSPLGHGAYLRFGDLELLSGSMETLLHYDAYTRIAESLPIKGTRANAKTLLEHTKEKAEHVMIVDLVRNDLGKVCAPGTVTVPHLMQAHAFPGLVHGISTVCGQLRQDKSHADLLAALFPGGSITGAPKRRAMEYIQAIEARPRGFYTGSLGYLTSNGDAHFSILIRTLVADPHPSTAQHKEWTLSVGGGIVHDSDPAREIAETWEKVSVFQELWR